MGNDKNFSIGLTVELSKPNITVRINSDLKDPIYILSIKFDTTYKDIALITINSDTFFIFNILSFKALNIYKYYRVLQHNVYKSIYILYYGKYILTMI